MHRHQSLDPEAGLNSVAALILPGGIEAAENAITVHHANKHLLFIDTQLPALSSWRRPRMTTSMPSPSTSPVLHLQARRCRMTGVTVINQSHLAGRCSELHEAWEGSADARQGLARRYPPGAFARVVDATEHRRWRKPRTDLKVPDTFGSHRPSPWR